MLKHKKWLVGCAAIFITVVSAFGQSTGTRVLPLPPVGLAVSETAQVNVVNIGLIPVNGGIEPYCGGTIAFYNPGGSVVGTVSAFSLAPGQMFSAVLPFASAGAAGSRAMIRATITLTPVNLPSDAGPVAAPCSLASSFETYDTATGVTHAIVTATVR